MRSHSSHQHQVYMAETLSAAGVEPVEDAAAALGRERVLRTLVRTAPVAVIMSEVQVGVPELTGWMLSQGVCIPSHAQE